jgi:thiamine pyrophosphokinase
MKSALLFLNGLPPKYISSKTFDIIGCTDGAYHYAKDLEIRLDFVIGDFDSIKPTEIKNIEVIEKPDQNFTDFEKAIKYLLEIGVTHVDIWGASGKEEDHFLGNISILYQYYKKIEIVFYSEKHYFMMAKKTTQITTEIGKIISLFPLNKVKNITTQGLEFPLNQENLKIGKRIGIRNKAIENKVVVEIKSGKLILFIEK